jgi:hypothetical protein
MAQRIWANVRKLEEHLNLNAIMNLFPNEQNFDLDKSRQKFHHSLKEHHKISNIPKFRCEMLLNVDKIALRSLPFFSHIVFVLRTEN